MKPEAYLIPLCLCAVSALAQTESEKHVDVQQFIDEFSGLPDGGGDYEGLYENMLQIRSSPIDLNTATREELELLNILSPAQIEGFLQYRKAQGPLLDVLELQAVPGWDGEAIALLLPFVHIRDPRQQIDPSLFDRLFAAGNTYVLTRYARTLETKKGFRASPGQPASYRGSADNLYFRLRSAVPGEISLGITGEKDAGEALTFSRADHQWGFDFTSYHLQLKNKGRLKNFIAGDFQPQFGQGLLLGGSFAAGKGAESVLTSRKSNVGFVPYTSSHESAFQRGAALTLEVARHITLSAFYSSLRKDAPVDSDEDSTGVSLQTTGYHRTPQELASRKKIQEQGLGLIAAFKGERLDAGVIVHRIAFDATLRRKPSLYNQYAFAGNDQLNTGTYLNYRFHNISFFGEVGHSYGGGRGGIVGLLMNPHTTVDLSVVYRNYMRNFYSFTGNALSENTAAQNERGVYWGWKYRPNRTLQFTGYVDLFTFPWLAFRRYMPSSGYEWLTSIRYAPSKTTRISLQLRRESKARNLSHPAPLYRVWQGVKTNFITQVDYGIGEAIRLRSRVQYNEFLLKEMGTEGFALIQDVSFSYGRFKLTARHAVFESGQFENRHYVYEHDAWLSYSMPAYTDTGVRNYALLEIKMSKRLTLWLRYARTRLQNSDEIGSGGDVIEGNTRNDVKFQARIRF